MILPHDTHPKQSLYYNGALILKELKENDRIGLIELYLRVRRNQEIVEKIEKYKMSFNIYLYSLDWLYLIQAVEMREGKICLLKV